MDQLRLFPTVGFNIFGGFPQKNRLGTTTRLFLRVYYVYASFINHPAIPAIEAQTRA